MSLRVDNLRIGRAGRPLLDGLSFEVPSGTALALRGANGLGKTTLLRTLAGLMPPLSGALTHDAEEVAYAAHLDALKPALTVQETLKFWAQLYGSDRVPEALAAFHLRDLAQRPGGALSAGQRRRCALARLVVSGRPIWLMDEPTAALDTLGQAELAQVLKTHLATGGVALMVTHTALPLDCAELDLTPFKAGLSMSDEPFAEALE